MKTLAIVAYGVLCAVIGFIWGVVFTLHFYVRPLLDMMVGG